MEEHLTEEIDYKRVAKEAACSSFYFQKIFGILCGITLGDYIRSRRLTLAGNELSSTDNKVIDIASKYGYESPESFTRAFRGFHGVTPSEARKDSSKLKSFSRLSVKITLSGGNIMDYKIIEKEAFDIIEKVESHDVENSQNAKSIPARTWAVFECKGAMPNAMQDMWHKIVSEFFPASGYEPTYEMDIEAYSNGDMCSPDYRSEIWVPVIKK